MSLALRLPLICCSRSAVIGGVRSSLTATQHLSRHFTTNSIQHGILSKAASQQLSAMNRSRGFFLANTLPRTSTRAYSEKKAVTEGNTTDATQNAVPESDEFTLSDRAKAASQVNYSARLSKRTTSAPTGGWAEIKRLFSLASGEKRALAGAIALLVITSCISVVFPSSIGAILDSTSKPAGENLIFGMQPAVFYASLSGLFVVGAITNTGRITLLRIIGERLVARLRIDLYRKTVHQDAEFFDANRVGDLISRLSSDSNIVAKSLTQNVSDGLRSALSCIFSFAMMGYVSLKLTSITILILPPIALGSYYYGRKIRQLSRELQESIGTLTKVSEERLSNIRTAQSFAGESKEIKLYADKVREVFSIGKREAQAAGIYFGSTQLTGNLTVLGLLALGSQMVISGELTIGELTSFTMYTGYAGSSAYGLSSFYSELMKGVGAATRLFELVDRQPSIHSTKGLPVTAESARKTINFQNVAFAYPTRPALKIFRDLTFSIPPGSNVCIVGPSGGGKSTITSLLLRCYDVNAGSISIGDTDIRDMNLKALRRHIGVVSQEPALFSGTIADNIAYGVPNATKAEIASAARRANCSFISDFPLGMDTKVGNRGTQLSGGQKQRIAIARALIKNPSILILDEATSALDAESEAAVTETLAILMREHRTTISIAHRLSTIKRSDVVIVLNSSGGVAEHGKFADLYADRNSALSQLLKAKEELELDGGDSTMKESDVACLGKESAEEKMREEEFLEGEIDQEIRDEVEEQERVDRTARPL